MATIRKRVLFLAPYLGGGGINTHMMTLGRELTRLGWDVAVCSGGSLDDPAELDMRSAASQGQSAPVVSDYERAGILHFQVPFPYGMYRRSGLVRSLKVPMAMAHVTRIIRRFRPSLLHSHSRQMGIYARTARLLGGPPFLSTVHNPIPTRNRLWASTIGARAIAVSGGIEDILIRDYGLDPGRVRVIAPGVDAAYFRPPTPAERRSSRQAYGFGDGQFALAFIGSLDMNKRPDMVVKAVADLTAAGHDVVALVAGEGPRSEALRAYVRESGLEERVRQLGYQEARHVLWAADTLVLPSRTEGYGLVVAEAMLSGVVVACTPAASGQVTPGMTGLVFDFDDHQALVRGIAELIARPDTRSRLRAGALEFARDNSSSTYTAKLVEQTYRDVLDASR